jgi:endonuclease YncB( thermonuclease family)
MTFLKSSKFFLLTAILTLVMCLVSVRKRIHVENLNKNVMIATEMDNLQSLAAAQGIPIEEALTRLEKVGINGIVIPEDTIGELIINGKAHINGQTVQHQSNVSSMSFEDPDTVARVVKGLTIRYGKLVQSTTLRDGRLALPAVDTATLRTTSIGLDPQAVALAQKHHLAIVGRYSNPVGTNSVAIAETLKWAKESGVKVFLAQGEQVLGRRDSLDVTKEGLISNDILYASPEFAKLGGDQEMLVKIPDRVIRLHSAQTAELDKLSEDGALERYMKAAKERNMRILLVRNISQASDAPLDAFGDFLAKLSDGLTKKGLKLGEPTPYADPELSKIIKILIGVFGGASALWVAVQLFGERRGLPLGVVGGLMITAGSALHGTGLEVAALLLSMVFPIGSYFWLKAEKPNAYLGLLGLVGLSMVGGFCVAGLMNAIPFFIRAEVFSGVKLSVFLPIAIVGIVAFADFNNFKESMKEPITWGAAGIGLLIFAALALMMLRTGNDNPNTVSGGELAFRGILEQILPVRPRTKEFILGFPALFFGLFVLHAAKYDAKNLGKLSGWVSLCIMLGFVGLTDSVNTLCHLHTPVLVSFWRDIIGLVIGALLGLIAWFIFKGKVMKSLEVNNG